MRIRKILGLFLYNLIGIHLPKSNTIFSGGGFRRMCAKMILSSCGKRVNIEKGASFSSKCTIGDYSGIGVNANLGETHIGSYVMMGPNCSIITRNHRFDRTDIPMMKQGFYETKPVYIGNDVWIGRNVTILPGVHINDGAIIGAGSIVTHDVESYSIVGGNPAKLIRYRKEM